MNSIAKTSPTNNKNVKIHTNSSPILSKLKWRHSSFSSNSSSSSSFTSSSLEEEFSLPNTPSSSSSSSSLSRIPFSWETIPGIPKTQVLKKIDSCRNSKLTILPLPPPASNNAKKGHSVTSSDPFYAALIECSKRSDVDNQEVVFNSGSIAKSISTRFGQVNMSCKNYTKVANSVIFMPRGGQKRISNEVLKKHFG